MTRLILLLSFIPTFAMAADFEISAYVPPPMFGESIVFKQKEPYPPLPPRRPDKINVPQSYIDYMRKHGKAPALIQSVAAAKTHDIYVENLIQPSSQDILEQINPQ